ncbi:TetR/AcrR family transcriptional repressor of mexJK operon [Rhizobium sp. SG_E_25_P2]|uniref:TetR/AcrR family transcriptional regulator n=1 Tax=Rhizobium sp. SG_E_25_P2 TaxID=2879942 RepID=UPI00247332EB|nr:TetR/AcrR family transcriptional regulator [Rhizobium sp. SG_E_25_P2]MDH6269094.1 TetR/AcrR family transcriptional repressor of mexJK operon [Rhizobium sp. SG_E_25_P2]
MAKAPPKPRSGRPKDPVKRQAIVAAATVMFTEQAYEDVTVEAVAAKAGVSKVTIYNSFKDKDTLFETVIDSIMEGVVGDPAWAETGQPLKQRLNQIGAVFLTSALGPYGRMMVRTLSVVLHGNVELSKRLYEAAPGRAYAAVAAVVEEAMAKGTVKADSARLAAEDLISLWEGGLMVKAAIGLSEPVSQEEINRRVWRGTEVFMRAYCQ